MKPGKLLILGLFFWAFFFSSKELQMSDPKSCFKVNPEPLCMSAPDSKVEIYYSCLTGSYIRDHDILSAYGDTMEI